MYEDEKLGVILRRMKVVDKDTLIKGLKIQKVKGGQLGNILVKLGAIKPADLNRALALQKGSDLT